MPADLSGARRPRLHACGVGHVELDEVELAAPALLSQLGSELAQFTCRLGVAHAGDDARAARARSELPDELEANAAVGAGDGRGELLLLRGDGGGAHARSTRARCAAPAGASNCCSTPLRAP